MSENKQSGRTYVDWSNMKKTSVQIDRDGNQIEIDQPQTGKPKSLEDLMKQRLKRMGR